MKFFICSFVLACLVGVPANAEGPKGYFSCKEAARLNAAAIIMSVITGTNSPVTFTCE